MADMRLFAGTSNLVRFTLKNSSTGQPLTGLTGSSAGLIISTIADVEASATTYTQAASHIQTIATLGTFAAPSASNCRFGEVDSANHPGLYEFQIADARFAVSNAKRLVISVSGAASLLPADYEIRLVQFNPDDAVHLGLSCLPNTACTSNASLITSGSGTDQLIVESGVCDANVSQINDDTTAPANLASTFNGTGYVATTAPAQQQQVANIAVTGSPVNAVASSFTQTTGSVTSGTYTDTFTKNGTYHITADATGTIDEYYEFDLSPTASGNVAVGSGIIFAGYVTSAVNSVKVYAYNWGNAAWDQIGTIVGATTIVVQEVSFDLSTAHTGTGGNLGVVRIRFQNTGLTSLALGIDRLLVGFANVLDASSLTTTIFAAAIDGAYNFKQYTRAIGAATAGAVSGGPGGPMAFKSLDAGTTYITASADSSGNRSSFTYNV